MSVNVTREALETRVSSIPPIRPRQAADALIAKRNILRPSEIKIELLAYAEGACVVWRDDVGRADARITRAGEDAYIAIAKSMRGTPRGRFSAAHDLAHHLLHRDRDDRDRIHGLPREDRLAFKCEWEANEFARHLLVPTLIAAPMCTSPQPDLARVLAFAAELDVSLSVAGRRWAEMSPAPCAFVEAKHGVIKWATRSAAFRGEAVQRRVLPDGSLALDLTCGWSRSERTRVHRAAWGSANLRGEIIEECVTLGKSGTILTWLWHA